MRVVRGLSTNKNQPLTSPLPAGNGVFFELRGGDVCDPVQIGGKWFEPPWPKRLLRFWLPLCTFPVCALVLMALAWRYSGWFLLALPFMPGYFLSWRWGDIDGYIGTKAYGADSPAYKNWMNPWEVFDGSYALCFSCRPLSGFKQRLLNLIIAFDQLAYVLLTLGYGMPDETLSSAAWRAERDDKFFGFTRPAIDWVLSWLEEDHCWKSYESEVLRRQMPSEFRQGGKDE